MINKSNDWYPIVTKKHIINGTDEPIDGLTHGNDEVCIYEILHSKSRNEYKLECEGPNYKIYPEYDDAVAILSTFKQLEENKRHESPVEIVFRALEQSCLDDGGDRDSMFVSKEYSVYADKFELWLERNKNSHWKKTIYDTYIMFTNDQEVIWFSDNPGVCPYSAEVFSYYQK